jgi:acetoin utilization protein AcuB
MNAEEIMTAEIASVKSSDTLGKAMALLAELDVRHLPVLDNGELVGMLSDRDLRDLGIHRLDDLESLDRMQSVKKMRVSDVMSADVLSVAPGASVREIIDLMVEEKVGAVPVVDGHTGGIVGIVSYVDVLRAAASELD